MEALLTQIQAQAQDILVQIYELMEAYGLTVNKLIAIAAVLAIAILFTAREAASWFFKVDGVKRQLRKVQESNERIEAQLQALHARLDAARTPAETPAPVVTTEEPKAKAFTITH